MRFQHLSGSNCNPQKKQTPFWGFSETMDSPKPISRSFAKDDYLCKFLSRRIFADESSPSNVPLQDFLQDKWRSMEDHRYGGGQGPSDT
ncbi:hypothetical protein L3X38_010226 [Prunus dulcis]|uniref:Uncharacterized protein n=1 Tax=Prunus dulcis TaxID=3755 RepID=A0AAD4ZE89_PRUDU|nr:hypothetical protein L3X38_010226 [Prunus dulcis]